ncbi:MAG: PLDc N-terminal domain-containing protein [Candidatus Woesearchaeota archaeon]
MKKVRKNKIFVMIVFLFGILMLSNSIFAFGDLKINKLSQDPDPAAPNRLLNLRLKVENIGDEYIDDLNIEVLEDYPFEIYRDEKIEVGSLPPYQQDDYAAVFNFKIFVQEGVPPGEYDLRVKYYNDEDKPVITNIPVEIENKEIIFDIPQLSLDPKEVLPSQEGTLNFYLNNDGTVKARDVEVFFNLPDGFSVVDSTDVRSFLSFDPNRQKEISFDYLVNPSTPPGNHEGTISLAYKNEDRTETFEKEFSFNFFVEVINNVERHIRRAELTKNEESDVSINIINKGTENIKFTTVELLESSDYDIVSGTVFLGEVETNDYETADFTIIPHEENINLEYRVEWNDFFNEKHTEEFSNSFNVNVPTDENGSTSGMIFGWVVGLTMFIFWVFMLIDVIQAERDNKLKKYVWIGVVALTFFLGAILYYLFGRSKYR